MGGGRRARDRYRIHWRKNRRRGSETGVVAPRIGPNDPRRLPTRWTQLARLPSSRRSGPTWGSAPRERSREMFFGRESGRGLLECELGGLDRAGEAGGASSCAPCLPAFGLESVGSCAGVHRPRENQQAKFEIS